MNGTVKIEHWTVTIDGRTTRISGRVPANREKREILRRRASSTRSLWRRTHAGRSAIRRSTTRLLCESVSPATRTGTAGACRGGLMGSSLTSTATACAAHWNALAAEHRSGARSDAALSLGGRRMARGLQRRSSEEARRPARGDCAWRLSTDRPRALDRRAPSRRRQPCGRRQRPGPDSPRPEGARAQRVAAAA
jgi:hypothetical protein